MALKNIRPYLILVIFLLLLQAAVLYLMGHPAFCTCGVVKLWEGAVKSSGNSQQLTDWYTFSHIIHGFIFYLFLWLLFPRSPIGLRLLLAVGIEVSWEILENTPWVINHYREQALAQGYIGDSILNSISDSLSMMFGFFLARKAPTTLIVALALSLEIFTGYFIRDNLTFNVINLVHTIPALNEWQSQSPHP